MIESGSLALNVAGRVVTQLFSTLVPANMLTASEDFTNAAWVKSECTIAPNIVTAPDASLTADQLIESTTPTIAHYMWQNMTGVSGTAYTLSAYFKKSPGAPRFAQLIFTGTIFTTNRVMSIDLVTGQTVTSVGAVATSSSADNGWWRASLTATATASATSSFQIRASHALATTPAAYTGDGISGLYLWGALLNTGSTANPYSPFFAMKFNAGTPTTPAGSLVLDAGGAINAYVAGLPYTAGSALAVTADAAVSGYASGLALSAGRVAVSYANPIAGYVAGLPVDAAGRLCCVTPV